MLPISIVREAIMRIFGMMSGPDFWNLIHRFFISPTSSILPIVLVAGSVSAWILCYGRKPKIQGFYEICLCCISFCKQRHTGVRFFLNTRFNAAETGSTTLTSCGYMQIFNGDDLLVGAFDIRCVIDLAEKNGYLQLQPSHNASEPDAAIQEFIQELRDKKLKLEMIDFGRDSSHWSGEWHLGDYTYGTFNAVKNME